MILTDDELTVIIESLREYRLRLAVNSGRRVVAEALIFRGVETLNKRVKQDAQKED